MAQLGKISTTVTHIVRLWLGWHCHYAKTTESKQNI